MNASRKQQRKVVKKSVTKKPSANGQAKEIPVGAEDAVLLREADTAIVRLKLALADVELQTLRLAAQRREIIEGIERAQQAMYARGKAVADKVTTSPDDRWNLDLGKMVLQRL